jgi:tetratricopeptide (TPR) repeat protein
MRSFIQSGCAVLMAGLIAAAAGARAGDMIPGYPDNIDAYDERDLQLLPRYCIYTLSYRQHIKRGNDPTEVAKWYELMGPTFHHMHHYCNGLVDTNRALLLAPNPRVRNFYLRASITEFDYVLERATPEFVMLPEILTKKGENLLRLDEYGEGLRALQQAIAAKPDYWPPYVVLSDFFKKKGNEDQAREWLERALKFAPDTKALTSRLAELDKRKPSAGR